MQHHPVEIFAMESLRWISKFIAYIVAVGLLISSALMIVQTFEVLLTGNVKAAIQDGLFVLILLEMFYVVRSFIKYLSINVGLIVNVGIIAAVKEMILKMDKLDLELAGSFGIIFVTLGFIYWMEANHFKKVDHEC
ncbi:phosphate-starvation-inducible PsiE family protein [Candidatus Peregrinibacteria bacterium]|nr:MAG: phosphate-starvation-inducible PsiE family protein [Candidatus Peregrinibacteria bacterium]